MQQRKTLIGLGEIASHLCHAFAGEIQRGIWLLGKIGHVFQDQYPRVPKVNSSVLCISHPAWSFWPLEGDPELTGSQY